jgi:DNA-3-methyladenine glycosylase
VNAYVSTRNTGGGLKLTREFYAQPVLAVARECIGKILVHRTPEGEAAGRIVEAEAYRGPLDLAAHSSRGLTKRTAAMFGPPGYAYVYLLYGTSWALNLVAASDGEPHAVLIRALEPVRARYVDLRIIRVWGDYGLSCEMGASGIRTSPYGIAAQSPASVN